MADGSRNSTVINPSGSLAEKNESAHFICNKIDREKAMIQCDKCLKWFHFQCLKIPDCVSSNNNRSVFYCGLSLFCNNNAIYLCIDGKEIMSKSRKN